SSRLRLELAGRTPRRRRAPPHPSRSMGELLVYPVQVEHGVDLSNQMIWRNYLVQIKRIKELTLPDFPPTHHEPPPRIIPHRRNHGSSIVSTRVLQQNPSNTGHINAQQQNAALCH